MNGWIASILAYAAVGTAVTICCSYYLIKHPDPSEPSPGEARDQIFIILLSFLAGAAFFFLAWYS